jgi:hypothetical protein
MVENVKSVKKKLLMRKLGVTETSTVQNIFVKFVFPNFGFEFSVKTHDFHSSRIDFFLKCIFR